jgi:hypothetical protein
MPSLFTKRIPTPKIPVPRQNPRGSHAGPKGFPHVTPPRLKPLQTRVYTKAAARQDPMEFTGLGFGDTGMTGES